MRCSRTAKRSVCWRTGRPPVQGPDADWPGSPAAEAERIRGDLRDAALVRSALAGIEVVYRQPALTGLARSLYRSARDLEANSVSAGDALKRARTPHSRPLQPTSVYASTRRDYRELFGSVGSAYRIPVVALRYFNGYGSRQALSSPYPGVAAIFSSRLPNRRRPRVHEDRGQTLDFMHVSDVVRANPAALHCPAEEGCV